MSSRRLSSAEILDKHLSGGVLVGEELFLPVRRLRAYLDELAHHGYAILGIDGYTSLGENVQTDERLISPDFTKSKSGRWQEIVQETAREAKEWLDRVESGGTGKVFVVMSCDETEFWEMRSSLTPRLP
jgi:hypothetical protein